MERSSIWSDPRIPDGSSSVIVQPLCADLVAPSATGSAQSWSIDRCADRRPGTSGYLCPLGSAFRHGSGGEPGSGGAEAGDLYLRVRHAAHPDFHTEGADVFYDLEIAPWDAVLGADISVPTLDGTVKLRIPPDSEHGNQLRVRGRGLPIGKTGGRGDFHAVIHIIVPTQSTAEERNLWEKLREVSRFNPRTQPHA